MDDIPTVLVYATTANVQKYIRHPLVPNVPFPDDVNQPLSWPFDSYTFTRLRDGDVVLSPPGQLLGAPSGTPLGAPSAPEPQQLSGTIAAEAEVVPPQTKKGKKE